MSDHTVAEAGYQERDDCAEAVAAALTEGQVGELFYAHDPDELRAKANEFLAEAVAAALTEGDEAVRIWHTQYSRVRAECDALRAAIEALADKWEGDRLNRVIDKEGAAYLLRDALQAKP